MFLHFCRREFTRPQAVRGKWERSRYRLPFRTILDREIRVVPAGVLTFVRYYLP